jgi:quinol monooxygenase YgiN
MTILDTNAGYVVIINTFSVDPAKADELLRVLIEATEQGVSKRPGFVSANWHISMDKRHVTNYAQWRSQGDIDAMMADPNVQKHLKKAHDLADRVEPIFYELRATLKAAQ